MIRNAWAALPLLLLTSCGIITIEYLPPPPVDNYVDQTDFAKLQYTHNDSTYTSNADFQGYEIYYKLYAPLSGPFDNLAADYSALLATTPTVDYLVNLGYQRLTTSDLNSGNLPIVDKPDDNDVVTLDFTNFLSVMNVPTPPTNHTGTTELGARPTLEVTGDSPVFVFRTIKSSSSVFSYPWFSDLYKPWTTSTSDMQKGSGSNAISQSTPAYQIAVFLVAYSFTPEQTVYSQPVPWGVIGGGLGDPNLLKVIP